MEEGRITPRRASNSPPVPSGIRVLVVDDDSVSLLTVKKMLISCKYRACGCNSAAIALKLLQEQPHAYDIVLTDIYMPKMDGFRLLGRIGEETDLPVIMLSVDKQPNIAARGLADGASLFLTKPASMDDLRNIWQYVMRRRRNKEMVVGEQSGRILDKGEEEQVLSEETEEKNDSLDEDNRRKDCKRKMDEKEVESVEEKFRKKKKPRVVWTPALHAEFLKAIHQLGDDKAVPKTILEVMNIPGLTRDNVASHLQKFRQHLRRVSRGEVQNDHSSSLHLDSASSGSLPSDKPTTHMNFFPQQPHNTRNMNLLEQYRTPSTPIHRPIANLPTARYGNTGYSLPANRFTSQPYPYFNFSSMGGNTGTPQCRNLLSTVGASNPRIDPNNTKNLNLEVRMRLPPTPPFGMFNLGVGGNGMGSSGRGTSNQSGYNSFRSSYNGFHPQDHGCGGGVRGEASSSTSQAARIPAWLKGDQKYGNGV